MNTVFIFGAGASRMGGGPLMSDFLDVAEKLHRTTLRKSAAFEDVFRAVSELQSVYAKSYLDLDNFETLFGAIEMAKIISRFGSRSLDEINRLKDSIVELIVTTLESNIEFPVNSQYCMAPKPYGAFAKMLSTLYKKRMQTHNFSFLTFNYDIGLDYALEMEHISGGFLGTDYCLGADTKPQGYPLLKLHGSINWGKCAECGEIIPIRIPTPWKVTQFRDEKTEIMHLSMKSSLNEAKHCGKPLLSTPVIVPPTWNKTGYQGNLTNVWKIAAKTLSEAENIFVIGYSLPETDSFFRYLFALGSEGETRIKRFWVFDPDLRVEPRFKAIIGRAIEKRFKFRELKFDGQAITEIEAELEKPV